MCLPPGTAGKKDKSLGLTLDPNELNRNIQRKYFPLPAKGDVFNTMAGDVSSFMLLAATLGSLQIALTEKTLRVCIFNALDGRCFLYKFPSGF